MLCTTAVNTSNTTRTQTGASGLDTNFVLLCDYYSIQLKKLILVIFADIT